MTRTKLLTIRLASGPVVEGIATVPAQADSAYVFAHGAGAGMTHPFMVAVANGLAQRRIAALRYQFPSMQAGKRRVDSPAVAHETVRAAVARARTLWPSLPMFAGGKSFGGRMTSQAQAITPLPAVLGLIFLGFPLHPQGKPSIGRAAHLASVDAPMLFVHGTRDALAQPLPFKQITSQLGVIASSVEVQEADHSFHVPRRTGRTDDEVLDDLLDAVAVWTQAFHMDADSPRNGDTA